MRMVLEDKESTETWRDAAEYWFNKLVDKFPQIGTSYIRFADLAPRNTLEQLTYCLRSQICLVPFIGARESIRAAFYDASYGKTLSRMKNAVREAAFIKIHAKLFEERKPTDEIENLSKEFHLSILDAYIRGNGDRFLQQGVSIALTNIAAMFEYGVSRDSQPSRPLFRLHYLKVGIRKRTLPGEEQLGINLGTFDQEVAREQTDTEVASAMGTIASASRISFATLRVVLRPSCGDDVLPTVHVMLSFIWSLVSVEQLLTLVEHDIPWPDICLFLNALMQNTTVTPDLRTMALPRPENGLPLPEDFAIRGQLFALWYYPVGWFENATTNIEERAFERPSIMLTRRVRLLWLGLSIASVSCPLINYVCIKASL
ncbi:MAG: hypothetical protein Q9180_007366 [Flavoplaca navasiana]